MTEKSTRKAPKIPTGRFIAFILISLIGYLSCYYQSYITGQVHLILLSHILPRIYVQNTRPMQYGPKPLGYDSMPLDTDFGFFIKIKFRVWWRSKEI